MEENKNYAKTQKNLRNILLLGFVSFFIDMSTEMVYPILPLFLISLGTAPSIIGIIEGISESVAAFLKAGSGYISDKTNKKKTLAVIGYSSSLIYKIGIFFSASWVGIMFSKIIDRAGKGIRVAPRDSLIAESGGKKLGGAYGIHKMLDMLGAAFGVLLAIIVMAFDFPYKTVFLFSALPAVIGVIILLFVKSERNQKNELNIKLDKLRLRDVKLSKNLIFYILTVFVFSIGNSSNAFLLLKAQNAGLTTQNVLIVYLLFNLVSSLLAVPFGKMSDKTGKKPVIVCAYILYFAVYLGFALTSDQISIFILFFVYGIYSALISGAEKALIVELSPKEIKGTTLGLQGMVQGIGLLISSTLAGALWQYAGTDFPFYFGSGLALIASVMMLFVKTSEKKAKLC